MIIMLGRPTHLDVTSPSLRGKIRLAACGRGGTTIATTDDLDKVDCLSCRRTKKFKVLACMAKEARDGR